MKIIKKIINDLIRSRIKNPGDLAVFKRKISKKYEIPCPSNIELLKAYHEFAKNNRTRLSRKLEELLKTRPVRSLSGIVNVSVLTKPYPCPGQCLYCPAEKGFPKSYVSGEPAAERAKKLNYDPYLQIKRRIEMLQKEGHPTDKIEIRVVGGTWSYYRHKYQDWFIKRCFDACNRKATKNLYEAQKLNERAKDRIIGLSIETRPDFIDKEEIKRLRNFGATMVELGIQSIYDDVLRKNLRGHGVKEIISATKLLKDAGFKILYQMMPNLTGSDIKKDREMFKQLFLDTNFRPDLLKIYPCAILKEAPLYNYWKKGRYSPYTEKQLISLLKNIKKNLPYYVRVQRISRDIPSQIIVAGPAKISNLRQIISDSSRKEKWTCKCIRCREVKGKYDLKEKIHLFRIDYEASGGKEIFLSFENKDRTKLYSLLRLRITSDNSAIIREIHTYGQLTPISGIKTSAQHKGLGKKLVKTAEEIAKKEFNLNKISIISGVGARNYFKKLGYRLENTYMTKKI